MKKLVFAVIAAVAMVSVSNVFASNKMANVASAAPVDTVAPADTTVSETESTAQPTAEAPVQTTETSVQSVETPIQTNEAPADSTVSTSVAK